MFFAGIFGINTTPVGADATAIIGSPGEYTGVVPWGVVEADWVPGEEYELKCGPPGHGGGAETGNFQALALGDRGDLNYQQNVADGSNMVLSVGQWVLTEPGNLQGPSIAGTEARVEGHEDHAWNTFEELVNTTADGFELKKNDSQFIIIPIIPDLPEGRDEVEIIKFAPFIITDIQGHSIIGTFLNKALIVYEGSLSGVDDTGIRIIRLVD
jgi:hypothetical protein